MRSVSLHDKKTIEQLLRKNVYLHIYGLGDLDEFFWPYTIWYTTIGNEEESEIALLYFGQSVPTLLALSEKPDRMHDLIGSILHILPSRFYAHLSPGVENIFSKNHNLLCNGEHLRMALISKSIISNVDTSDTYRLSSDDMNEIVHFYQKSYPRNWFDPRMLETRQYYGIKIEDSLVSVAGVHVYSPEYKVAALGNIATAHGYRSKGYASQVTARTCQSLLGSECDIGLNVKADNNVAISCYRQLGFEPIASFGAYMIERK